MDFYAKEFQELTTAELYEILRARAEIFLLEQKIICQDMDGEDYRSLHCFLAQDGRIAAYMRAFYKDEAGTVVKIGRVLTLHHGKGVGRRLMENSIATIKERMRCAKICVDAQKHAVGFYEKFGFRAVSDEFLEEGVVHIAMELETGAE